MKDLIGSVLADSLEIIDRFDWLKYNIRLFSIDYCKMRTREIRNNEQKIIMEIKNM